MRVIFLSHDDYANFAFDQAESLKSVGVDCESYKLVPHTFNYAKQSRVIPLGSVHSEMQKADIIILMHSTTIFNPFLPAGKKIVVWHTGSPYRFNPNHMNGIFNAIVGLTLTDQCEFMELGAKNIHYNAATIDISKYKINTVSVEDMRTFGHFPSNPEVKGTQEILEMLTGVSGIPYKLNYETSKVSHSDQLERMSNCDIYIELFKPTLKGLPYGCFGVTAFEAAALGKVVITNNIFKEVYKKAYGECALRIANTKEEFIAEVKNLISQPAYQIAIKQEDTYDWLVENHSYQANGKRLKQLLGI